jgi:hypothetical protein
LDYQPNSEIGSSEMDFSADVSNFPAEIRRSTDYLDFPADDFVCLGKF